MSRRGKPQVNKGQTTHIDKGHPTHANGGQTAHSDETPPALIWGLLQNVFHNLKSTGQCYT